MILDPTDQRIRDQGFNFVPFDRYLASPFQIPNIQTDPNTGAGIVSVFQPRRINDDNAQSFNNQGVAGLIDNFTTDTRNRYFDRQPTPLVDDLRQSKLDKSFMGFPSFREQQLTGPDLGEFVGTDTDVPLELTTAGRIQGGLADLKNTAGNVFSKAMSFGPVSFALNAMDRFNTLSPVDQVFTEMNMGYTGPTVFGENKTGLSKDPYGINVRSAFGNYADYVRDFETDYTPEQLAQMSNFKRQQIAYYKNRQDLLNQLEKNPSIEVAAKAQGISLQEAARQAEAIDRQGRESAPGRDDAGNPGGSSGSVSAANEGTFCFDPNTLVQMADGSEKKIKEIQLGDQTKGGEVTGVFQFKASDEIHDYKGVTVAGSHYVKEDGKFIMVQDSPISVKINKIPVVYSLDTTGRRIFIKDIEFADYNGDGVAKGFLANAGIKVPGFEKEVLRQVENRLI